MATLEELQDALINADKAGDTEAAMVLADAIRNYQPPAQRGVRAEYDAMPTWQKPLVAAADTVRTLGSGAGFGFAEKALAGIKSLGGGDYDQLLAAERQATQDAMDRSGGAGVASKLIGSLGPAVLMPAAGPIAASSTPSRMLQAGAIGAAEGGAYAGAEAYGNDRNVLEEGKKGMLVGGLLGPVVEGASTVVNDMFRRSHGVNATPSVDTLRTAKDDAYQAVEDTGAMYPPDRYTRMVQDLNTDLVRPHGGVREARHPNAYDTLQQLQDNVATNRPVSLYDLDQTRQGMFDDMILPGGNERRFGSRMVKGVDDMIADTNGVTTISGTPQSAVDSLLSARDLNNRLRKTEEVGSVVTKADRNAAAKGTGQTAGNEARQGIKTILNNDAKSIGYSPEEIGLMEDIVRGTKIGNAARKGANAVSGFTGKSVLGTAGSGAGLMLGGVPGATVGGGLGLGASSALGGVLRGVSERSTKKGIEELQHLTATGRRFERGRASGLMDAVTDANVRRALMALGLSAE